MNSKLKKIWQSATALIMAFVMMFSTCGTVFAEEELGKPTGSFTTEDAVKYVSLGDSMTNGYGFVGYKQVGKASEDYNLKEGKGVYGTGAYPLLFEQYLEEQHGTGKVQHTKLALSSTRVEELRYLLGITDEKSPDGWSGLFAYDGGMEEKELKQMYQEALKEADIISLALGNAAFDAFFYDRVMKTLGVINKYDEHENPPTLEMALAMLENSEQEQVIQTVYKLLKTRLVEGVPAGIIDTEKLEELCDLVAYITASFLLGYESIIEWIGENNENAEVILVGMVNSAYGISIGGEDWSFDLGEAMGAVYGAINAYIAALPALLQMCGECENVKFYYADQPSEPEMIAKKIPSLAGVNNSWGEKVDGIDVDLVRERTIEAYNSIVLGLLNKDSSTSLPRINLSDLSSDSTAEEALKAISKAVYLGLEQAVVKSMNSSEISFEAILRFTDEKRMAEVLKDKPTPESGDELGALVKKYSDFFGNDETGMLDFVRLFALTKVGNGISAHPTPATHQKIAESVIAAYRNHTAKDETIENILTALEELCRVLETYGPEVADQVWAQWEEYGYVGAVEETIDKLEEVLKARYEVYVQETVPAVNASVAALAEQKDALVAQLASLNEQLAVKKAELEKVLSEQEIGPVTVPEINININLGNNEQTTVPEHDCVVSVDKDAAVAEIEAAIKDIEHAIATIEALIADVEADIEDMVALAAQIADAVASLETTIKDIANAASDVKAAVAAVVAVLTDESAENIAATVVGTFETVRAAALEAANLLDITMNAAEETMADIHKMVDILSEDAEALYNKFMTDLPGCIEQIPTEVQVILGGAFMGLQKAYEEGEKLVKEKLLAELEALDAEYADDIEKAKADLEAKKAEIKAAIDVKYEEAKAEAQLKLEEAKAEAEGKLEALENELKQYQAELEALGTEAAEEVRQTIRAKIDRVTTDINTVNADLACALEHIDAALALAYEEIVDEVNALYEEALAELEKVYNDIMAELEAAKKALEEAAGKSLEELKAELDKQLAELNKAMEELTAELNAVLDSIRENMNQVKDAVEGILSGSLEAVEDLKEALKAMGAEALAELVDSIVAQIEAMLLEATTADMIVDDNFKYVALGDGSAVAEGYAEKLRAAINAEAAEKGVDAIDFENCARVDMTVTTARDNLSAVVDADLVTIGFSNVAFLSNAYSAKGNPDYDWGGLLGEEAMPYVEDILADIKAEIAALEIPDASIAQTLEATVEGMAYYMVEYTVALPDLISDIKAVNPDALIIIVGMYNPLANTTIDMVGNKLDVSEYIDSLVDAVAVYATAYAIISGDAIYVDARDVEVADPEGALADMSISLIELAEFMGSGFKALYPSTIGHDSIAAEIADALNITYVKAEPEKLLGDVNLDGRVTDADVGLLYRYVNGYANLSELQKQLGNVNKDERVTDADVGLLYRYVNGYASLE